MENHNFYEDHNFPIINLKLESIIFTLGTRYKRRGVDEEGNVANYVETEQVRRQIFITLLKE